MLETCRPTLEFAARFSVQRGELPQSVAVAVPEQWDRELDNATQVRSPRGQGRELAADDDIHVLVERDLQPVARPLTALGCRAHRTVWLMVAKEDRASTLYVRSLSRIDRYKALDLWSDDPALLHTGFDWLRNAMLASRAIRHGASYDACVDQDLL